jgi:hypothetical protein
MAAVAVFEEVYHQRVVLQLHNHQGESMAFAEILAEIDRDIAQLQQARAVLSNGAIPAEKRKPGRPKNSAAAETDKPVKAKKRNISPEGRKRIAEAVKKRWAAQRKAAAAGK